MAITTHESGSQTAVISTEHTLNVGGPETTLGLFMLQVDVNNLDQNASVLDRVRFRLYEKVQNAAGTQRLVFESMLRGRQVDKIYHSPSFILLNGWDWKLLQDEGTGRVFPWAIVQLGTASQHSTGAQTTVIGTEHTLTGAETASEVIQVVFDLGALAIGDKGQIRIKSKTRSADTQRVVFEKGFSALTSPILWTPLIEVQHDWDVTLEQTDGTGRSIPWSIRKLG